uniref:Cyclin N-terminal domain-containing protein n=1 Tax=Setaria digitata TaxID=48799 RepID=A0A915PX01_9BILA
MKESEPEGETSNDETSQVCRRLDPDFLDRTACLPAEMHSDWLSVLAAENSRRISDANEWNHVFHTPRSTEYIFTACTRLRLPQEVKYSALLIFDNFMVQLVSRLHESVYNSKRSDRRKYQEWDRIEATLSRQTTLRMLSAIQIASKMHSYHDSLSIKTVKLCLKTLGFAYTEESVVRSELRVLSMIDWEPTYHCTPLVYIESLFKILKTKWEQNVEASSYWQYILLVLDCVFIHWNDVYKRMMANVMGPSANIVTRFKKAVYYKEQMCRVQADWFLLACGVIVTAACCVDGMQAADEVTNELHRLSNIPLADITDMSVAIIECVVQQNQQDSTVTASNIQI